MKVSFHTALHAQSLRLLGEESLPSEEESNQYYILACFFLQRDLVEILTKNSTCLVLRSPSVTEDSSLLRLSLPAVSQPHLCCLFLLSILQNDTAFNCSLNQPEYKSCQLNPGCHVFSNQVSNTVCNGYKRNYPFSTSSFALTRLPNRFILIQLYHVHLRKSLFPFLTSSLTTLWFPINAV